MLTTKANLKLTPLILMNDQDTLILFKMLNDIKNYKENALYAILKC